MVPSGTVSEAVETRRSVREFDPDYAVPVEVLKEILRKALRTPSGGNLQPWRMYVLAGSARDELVDRVAERMSGVMRGEKREKSRYQLYPKGMEKKEHPLHSTAMARRRENGHQLYEDRRRR